MTIDVPDTEHDLVVVTPLTLCWQATVELSSPAELAGMKAIYEFLKTYFERVNSNVYTDPVAYVIGLVTDIE